LFDAVTEVLAVTSSTTRNKRVHINEELLLSPACNSEFTSRYHLTYLQLCLCSLQPYRGSYESLSVIS